MLSALISVESTVDDGNNYNTTYTTNGNVRVSNLTCYLHNGSCPDSVAIHALAHAYGEMSLASDCGIYNTEEDIIKTKFDYQYYCRTDRHEFAHRFFEYNKNDTQKSFPHFTKRIITASAGDCMEYDEVDSKVDKVGEMRAQEISYRNESFSDSISIPISSLGREGTTYICRDDKRPFEACEWAYGPRGLWMWAYKNPGAQNKPKVYQCSITISNVTNSRDPRHDIPNDVARAAAASIALQGRWRPDAAETTQIYTNYQFYASGWVLSRFQAWLSKLTQFCTPQLSLGDRHRWCREGWCEHGWVCNRISFHNDCQEQSLSHWRRCTSSGQSSQCQVEGLHCVMDLHRGDSHHGLCFNVFGGLAILIIFVWDRKIISTSSMTIYG